MISAKINDEHAKIQVRIKGAIQTVGSITDAYSPTHVGVSCPRDQEEMVRHYLNTLHEEGYWKEVTKNYQANFVCIRLRDIRKVLTQIKRT